MLTFPDVKSNSKDSVLHWSDGRTSCLPLDLDRLLSKQHVSYGRWNKGFLFSLTFQSIVVKCTFLGMEVWNLVSLLVGFCLLCNSNSCWAQVSASLLPTAFSSVRQGNPTHILLRFCCGYAGKSVTSRNLWAHVELLELLGWIWWRSSLWHLGTQQGGRRCLQEEDAGSALQLSCTGCHSVQQCLFTVLISAHGEPWVK